MFSSIVIRKSIKVILFSPFVPTIFEQTYSISSKDIWYITALGLTTFAFTYLKVFSINYSYPNIQIGVIRDKITSFCSG
jgi:hypothetical protein